MCADSERESCVVEVRARDFSTDLAVSGDNRAARLVDEVRSELGLPPHEPLAVASFGPAPLIRYITVKRSNAEYAYHTRGYFVVGAALIDFTYNSRDESGLDRQLFLKMIHETDPIDSTPVLAIQLRDYVDVCAKRFPAHTQSNETAFSTSRFNDVDVVSYLLSHGVGPDETTQWLKDDVAALDHTLSTWPLEEQSEVCRMIPARIRLADDSVRELQ